MKEMRMKMEKYEKESKMRKDRVRGVKVKSQRKAHPRVSRCSALRRGMAYQPHNPECRKKIEDVLENEANVRNQKARMQEFEEKERWRKEKKESKKEESRGGEDTHEKKSRTEEFVGGESKDSGGSSGSGGSSS
eukprot:1563601-Karenia_brevis.AAC.1